MDDIVLFQDKKDCCACGACLSICPKHAIKMVSDEYGFLYPQINKEKCIKCRMCIKTCAFQNSNLDNEPLIVYAAQNNSSDLKQSASGGVFVDIAKNILQKGGVVYGASMELINGKLEVQHIAVNNMDELIKLQGSKYVQSYTGKIYKDVREKLNNKKLVLFSGTPCQIDGLMLYLGKKYDNLITVDIICHGVPNNRMFQDYIRLLEKKYNDRLTDFKFRNKDKGWGLTAKVYTSKGDTFTIPSMQSSYYYMFLKSYIYRDSCYSCKYACKNRCADITIGDYWGIEKVHPEIFKDNIYKMYYKDGISCIIVNTMNGKEFLTKYQKNLNLIVSKFEYISKYNNQLNYSSNCNQYMRNKILYLYNKRGYRDIDMIYKGFAIVRLIAGNIIKRILKFKKYRRV